jgi:hypothetical protein
MRSLLITVILFEIAVVGAIGIVNLVVRAYDNVAIYSAAIEYERELRLCQNKHDILLKQIKVEGLWKRLGMGGQPWLQ